MKTSLNLVSIMKKWRKRLVNREIKGMRLLITIVDRSLGSKVVKLFEENGCHYHQIVYGKGTAPKEIYEYLGFGEIEKEVVLSVASADIVPFLIDSLKTEMHFDQPGHGVACTIPLDSVAGKSVLQEIISDQKFNQEILLKKAKEVK